MAYWPAWGYMFGGCCYFYGEGGEMMKNWETISDDFAIGVKNHLEMIGMSQKELSNKMSVSEQRVSEILSGRDNLSLKTIADVYIALGVDLVEFPDFKYFLNVSNLYAIG